MDPRASERDAFIGRDIGPNYKAVRRIGAGGMGAVYEAQHKATGAKAAIKILNKDMAADPMLLERFRREARITASFDNPNVVKVLEFDQLPDGVPYMVMEFLEGEDLEARLKRKKRLQPFEALELMRGMVSALSEAHAAGVIHRDIKPGNLFYAQTGTTEQIKLLDFGISKASNLTGDGLTVFGQVLGTVWYMSPEQARGEELTASSDVYSMAVVLFEALSGELPFLASSIPEYLITLQSQAPRSILQLAPELPIGLEGIFGRAMSRDIRLRPSSAKFFAEEFEDTMAMGSENTTVRRPSDPRVPKPPPAPAPAKSAARISGSGLRPGPPLPPAPPQKSVPPPPPPPKPGTQPPRRISTAAPIPPAAKVATDPRLRAAAPIRPDSAITPQEGMPDIDGSTQIARVMTPATPVEAVALDASGEPITLDEDKQPAGRPGPPVIESKGSMRAAPGRKSTSSFPGVAGPTALGMPAFEEEAPGIDSTRVVAPQPAPPLDVSDSTRVVPGPPRPVSSEEPVAPDAEGATRITGGPARTSPPRAPPIPAPPEEPEIAATVLGLDSFSEEPMYTAPEAEAAPPVEEITGPPRRVRPGFSRPAARAAALQAENLFTDHEVEPHDSAPEVTGELPAQSGPHKASGTGSTVIMGVGIGLLALALIIGLGWFAVHR
ncbi:MAG: protein kinase [Deltaproteobacteria bacterium]|nr:protein kinase [Deltaproteobacteria bacterium]